MTGHLNGTGEAGNLFQRNNQIRDFCAANNKVLFDFADIESYDPDGDYFRDLFANDSCDYDGGNWADEWCAENPGSPLCYRLRLRTLPASELQSQGQGFLVDAGPHRRHGGPALTNIPLPSPPPASPSPPPSADRTRRIRAWVSGAAVRGRSSGR